MIALLASSPKNTVTLTRQRVVEVADPYNSPPPEIPRRSTKLAAINQLLGTFARKLASLKQYGLVRLASQAVQPSQNIVAYRPWSGRYAPCFCHHRLELKRKNPPGIGRISYFITVSIAFLTSAATESISRAASMTTILSLSFSSSNAL